MGWGTSPTRYIRPDTTSSAPTSQQRLSRALNVASETITGQADLFDLHKNTQRYDCIILTEVIEHVPDPVEFLKAAASVLSPGGVLLVTTPNKTIAPLGTVWGTESPPVHLWWLSESSIRQIARRLGLLVKFGDFAPMFGRRARPEQGAATSGAPPSLDASGNVTAEAHDWVRNFNRREPWKRRLRSYAPALFYSIFRVQQARRAFGRYASERTWQLGAVLERRSEA